MGNKPSSPSTSSDLTSYDDAAAQQATNHDKSDFTSAQCLVDHLLPGDLVQQKGKWMHNWFYSHWAVYIGNGDVVHIDRHGNVIRGAMVEAFRDTDVRKNNNLDEIWIPRRRHDILCEARGKVGEQWSYNLITNNCEHFASLCRYGRKISLQTFGWYDVISKEISLKEYLYYQGKAVYEKCSTFLSWIKRRTAHMFSISVGNVHFGTLAVHADSNNNEK